MVPIWLHEVAIAAVLLGSLCALAIAGDEIKHPQPMWIMNLVWPITALFGNLLWMWAYFRFGRVATRHRMLASKQGKMTQTQRKPFSVMVGESAAHCGGGCALGDLCAEWLAFAVPAIAVELGWHAIFAEKIFSVWILDFIFAYVFGIAFQYFTIAPKRELSVTQGLIAAIKADTLSLAAWQIGMYGFMGIAYFWIFRRGLGVDLKVNSFEFWFMMQIAMLFGFVTAYPVNWWLLRAGLKESM